MADLTRGKPESTEPAAQHGFVRRAPATLADSMTVVVPEFSGEHIYEVARWMPRGAVLPKEGDEVLVVKDERGEAWVPAFRTL